MKVSLSIDDDVIREARRRAEATGTSVNQIGMTDPGALARDF
jgi:hypothetical protein